MDEINLGLGLGHETGLIWSRVWARRGLRRALAPRGLSAEEKRVKLVEIFHETLKELEKLGPKMKGIGTSRPTRESARSLVDDGLVQTDKVGSSNCASGSLRRIDVFWSFPSQRGTIMQNRLDAAKEAEKNHQKQIADTEENMKTEHAARIESVSILRLDARELSTKCAIQAERTSSLAKLSALKQQAAELETELQAYGACDPTKVEEKKRAVTLAKEAAVRWTDNYSILLAHFTRQNGVEAEEVRKYLGVSDDYEDIC
ncbi:hypothetical protein HETIRDRAFT_452150 [Heterobasidion irregulare TC 32-1]|uniref:Meiotic nuclear division protein 1 n=1 Tax=Heterobasidion irregulare (strain TC 32-1) TaxID=747525 RepID=W4K687_HETIT|nr:uncharacterized protein HETIRDRAFT_452150 [Heterobasidion irregulare TC 32-1]ETW80586.1 hypothetical protein HETIRDRAFT_452150 [Heterobasidion irregulare TC 32-1]